MLCDRRPPDGRGNAISSKAEFMADGVHESDQLKSLIIVVEARYGRLDVSINNTGGSSATALGACLGEADGITYASSFPALAQVSCVTGANLCCSRR